ncbi:hypothetical protein [Enterocloster sp.]
MQMAGMNFQTRSVFTSN